MIRQLSSAGPCKYLHNYYKKSYVKFLQKKEKKKNGYVNGLKPRIYYIT